MKWYQTLLSIFHSIQEWREQQKKDNNRMAIAIDNLTAAVSALTPVVASAVTAIQNAGSVVDLTPVQAAADSIISLTESLQAALTPASEGGTMPPVLPAALQSKK